MQDRLVQLRKAEQVGDTLLLVQVRQGLGSLIYCFVLLMLV